ncbi:MAG: hypothetical protein HY896_08425 [Deltaproteobacteria bacterium]|nr:hypothetical protein [Deltaproteobacteria bacterium]
MRRIFCLACFAMLLAVTCLGADEFHTGEYLPATQVELGKKPEAFAGRKVRVTDTYQFCGSDFCVDLHKKNINVRDYYCFAVGPLCVVRMYIKKDHPDAAQFGTLRKGDRLTVYGTFDHLGSNYRFIMVDRLVVEKPSP